MDHLKKYLSAHRDQLSDEEPDDAIWHVVSSRVQRKPKRRVLYLVVRCLAAACILLLAATGLYFLLSHHRDQRIGGVANVSRLAKPTPLKLLQPASGENNQSVTKNEIQPKTILALSSKNTIHKKKETKFRQPHVRGQEQALNYVNDITGFIENQKTIISSTPVTGVPAGYFTMLVNQYRSLDAEQRILQDKISMPSAGNTALLEKMIINLKKKIDVLESLKREIDKVNEAGKNKPGAEKIYIDII